MHMLSINEFRVVLLKKMPPLLVHILDCSQPQSQHRFFSLGGRKEEYWKTVCACILSPLKSSRVLIPRAYCNGLCAAYTRKGNIARTADIREKQNDLEIREENVLGQE